MTDVACTEFQRCLVEMIDDPESSSINQKPAEERLPYGKHLTSCETCKLFTDEKVKENIEKLLSSDRWFKAFYSMW